MTLAGWIRDRWLAGEISRRGASYSLSHSNEERERIQLRLLNAEWRRVVTSVPFYRGLIRERGLPVEFRSLAEFVEMVPGSSRATIGQSTGAMTCEGKPADFFRMTGGTTAQPVHLPAWNREKDMTRPDMWLGRSWYGIRPGSRLFLLWGHAHLLGTGWGGLLNARRVQLSDRLLGYRRWSAYDLRPERLKAAGRELLSFRPDYMIGYSVALDQFAACNLDLGRELRTLRLKAVIGTAEGFPSEDAAARISDLFGCPVAMEYGAVETAVMAHLRPGGGYSVFWRNFLLEVAEADASTPARRMRVTTLYPRAFPLVRYDLGDMIELEDGDRKASVGLTGFRRVVGRCNDYAILGDGALIHSEVFTHAVRSCPSIRAYQVVQNGADIRVNYLAAAELEAASVVEIRRKLGVVNRSMGSLRIDHVEKLERTVAGKTPMVIRRGNPEGAHS